MCLAIPGKIKKIEGRKVLVEYPGEERYAMVGDDGLAVGDYVLVQMGIAMQKVTEDQALEAWKGWKK